MLSALYIIYIYIILDIFAYTLWQDVGQLCKMLLSENCCIFQRLCVACTAACPGRTEVSGQTQHDLAFI